jgi:endonuclease YncB( thermonuclease family)
MPRLITSIVLACTLFGATAPVSAADWPVCSGGNRAARHLTCVVDGDTWWQNGVKYRLACVDAVEIDDARGIEARDELRQLLGRPDARIRDLRIKGRYKRSLAIIGVGDTTAGKILVSKGLAERKDYRDTRSWCHRL